MTNLNYKTFPDELRQKVPGFHSVYDEHIRDYDEVLPHVLLGDLVRFLSAEVCTQGAASLSLRAAMELLERALASSDPKLSELVSVSFLENLDPEDESFRTIRILFGPLLEKAYQAFNSRSA